ALRVNPINDQVSNAMGKGLRFSRPGACNDQQRDEVDRRPVRDAMLDGETLLPVQISQIFMCHGLHAFRLSSVGEGTIADSSLAVMIWFGTTSFAGKRRRRRSVLACDCELGTPVTVRKMPLSKNSSYC